MRDSTERPRFARAATRKRPPAKPPPPPRDISNVKPWAPAPVLEHAARRKRARTIASRKRTNDAATHVADSIDRIAALLSPCSPRQPHAKTARTSSNPESSVCPKVGSEPFFCPDAAGYIPPAAKDTADHKQACPQVGSEPLSYSDAAGYIPPVAEHSADKPQASQHNFALVPPGGGASPQGDPIAVQTAFAEPVGHSSSIFSTTADL
jgi:hypothetical protein